LLLRGRREIRPMTCAVAAREASRCTAPDRQDNIRIKNTFAGLREDLEKLMTQP
jgi:hypothetical protein